MDFSQPVQPPGGYAPPHLEQPAPPKTRRGRRKAKATTPEDGEQVTKKVVDSNKRMALVAAVVLALAVGFIALGSQSPGNFVVRVTEPIAAGDTINPDLHLEAVAVTDDMIEVGAYVGQTEAAALELAREDIAGARAQYPIPARSQLNKNDFNVEVALATPLKGNERLVSITASVASAVAGKIKTGDRVDIVASSNDVAGVILTDIEVVAVTASESQFQAVSNQQTGEDRNANPEDLLPGQPVPGIYTLRVAAVDVGKVVAINDAAKVTLVYRPAGGGDTPTAATSVLDVICGSDNVDRSSGCRN